MSLQAQEHGRQWAACVWPKSQAYSSQQQVLSVLPRPQPTTAAGLHWKTSPGWRLWSGPVRLHVLPLMPEAQQGTNCFVIVP